MMEYIINKRARASSSLNPFFPDKAINGKIDYINRWVTREPTGWITLDLGCPCLVEAYRCHFLGELRWLGYDVEKELNIASFNISANGIILDSVRDNVSNSVSKSITPVKTRSITFKILKAGSRENLMTASVVNFDVQARPLSQNPYLINLTTNIGNITPAFKSDKFNYTIDRNGEASIKIVPISADSNAIIRIGNTIVKSGTESIPITLSLTGDTKIEIIIWAEDEIYNSRYVFVVKAEVKKLSDLTAKTSAGKPIILNPSFDPTKKEYIGEIEFSDDNFNVQSISVIPIADSTVKISYKGYTTPSGTELNIANPIVGDNIFEITTSKLDECEPSVYNVNIFRKHSLYIKSIVSIPGNVIPAISKLVDQYSVKGGKSAKKTNVEIKAEDSSTKILVDIDGNKIEETDGRIAFETDISSTVKQAKVTVVSADGTTQKNYTLNIGK